MRSLTWRIALLLVLCPVLVLSQTTRRVPVYPADYVSAGTTYIPGIVPSAAANCAYAQGLTTRMDPTDKQLHIYIACMARTATGDTYVVNDFLVPTDATTGRYKGPAVYKRTLGPTGHPTYAGIEMRGLYWDPASTDCCLYASAGIAYDANNMLFTVLTRNRIENGRLVREGLWRFDRRVHPYTSPNISTDPTKGWVTVDGQSDGPGVMDGVVPVPPWWVTQFGGGRLAAGFGGKDSGSIGRSHWGPALAQFTPPASGSDATPVVAEALLGYPYNRSIKSGFKRAPRDIYYINDFSMYGFVGGKPNPSGDDWPRTVSTPPGYWMDVDVLRSGCAWPDTSSVSAFVCVAYTCGDGKNPPTGRGWYGANTSPPTDGHPASLNCYGSHHVLYTYAPSELGTVRKGTKRQDEAVPASYVPFLFPGVTYPIGCTGPNTPTGCKQSEPSLHLMPNGVSFEPMLRIFTVSLWDMTQSASRPRLAFFRLPGAGGPAVLPTKPAELTLQ